MLSVIGQTGKSRCWY